MTSPRLAPVSIYPIPSQPLPADHPVPLLLLEPLDDTTSEVESQKWTLSLCKRIVRSYTVQAWPNHDSSKVNMAFASLQPTGPATARRPQAAELGDYSATTDITSPLRCTGPEPLRPILCTYPIALGRSLPVTSSQLHAKQDAGFDIISLVYHGSSV